MAESEVCRMPIARLSDKGQITVPAPIRRKLGWKPGRELQVEVADDAITIRPLKSLDELEGIFHDYVRGRSPLSHEEETCLMELAVAEHVANE